MAGLISQKCSPSVFFLFSMMTSMLYRLIQLSKGSRSECQLELSMIREGVSWVMSLSLAPNISPHHKLPTMEHPIAGPSMPRFFSFSIQHGVLTLVQEALEECHFDWVKAHLPQAVRNERQDCAKAAKLFEWIADRRPRKSLRHEKDNFG